MGVLVTVCFAVAAVLAFLAAVYAPPAPPRFNLVAGALAFLCLGFTLMRLLGG
jgi:hypothetical protein